ncbi:MAG: hypothetical protein QM820_10615 [Minicystis sp.]
MSEEPRRGPLRAEAALALGLLLPALLLAANMWHVRGFTVDDSYISYRYARNLARGWGLVYNEGERVEGYTNFLWTVWLAGGIRLGIHPDVLAKLTGAAAAFGSLGVTYAIAGRLLPYRTLPCTATWLLATSVVFSGYAVFGLETSSFVFLVLAGTHRFLCETAAASADRGWRPIPWSGLVFALAGLTRPEAPMFIGILALFLGRRIVGRQNLLRGALFVVPVGAHLLFRRAYYGAWLPNTLAAKTGDLHAQVHAGWGYLQGYAAHAGPVLLLALAGLWLAVTGARRDLLALATIAFAMAAYVVVVGGDWMKYYRFLSPFEPFCFLLVDVGARRLVERRRAAITVALAAFAVVVLTWRRGALREAQADLLQNEKRFWDRAAGGTARWLNENGERGELAIGDIGYVGWATDYPILDTLGLVDPEISKLPGGYARKIGPRFADRFFARQPRYVRLISSGGDCQHPATARSRLLYEDPRFPVRYEVSGQVPLDGGFRWCIYQKKPAAL